MKSLYLIPLAVLNISANRSTSVKEVFRRDENVNVAFVLRSQCNNTNVLTENEQTIINSAIWTTHQLNYSEITPWLNFGLSIFKVCIEREEYDTVFELFRRKNEESLLGLINTSPPPAKIKRLCDTLELNNKQTVKCTLPLVKASIALLSALSWVENVTVIAPHEFIFDEFFQISHKKGICVNEYLFYNSTTPLINITTQYLVAFGCQDFLENVTKSISFTNSILVPLDDSVFSGELADNSYVISATRPSHSHDYEKDFYNPSPQVLEMAAPLLAYAQDLQELVASGKCNESKLKVCLKNFKSNRQEELDVARIFETLKLEPSSINYYIHKSENNTFLSSAFIYNIFHDNITSAVIDLNTNASKHGCKPTSVCKLDCKNFSFRNYVNMVSCDIRIRTESWVFAFLSLSLLGVLLCIALLIFLFVSICRRNVLEGNPVLTLLLLLTIMFMYCSVLPLSLQSCSEAQQSICVTRALGITLSFASAFSLMLSRSILLATASKEVGFLSHVSGSVQSFLTLFIFGVQVALSLQVVNRCDELFKQFSFVYLLSYNVMLLLLLLCLSPLIYKSDRNYKEGKYFTIAVVTTCLLWCIWIPLYVLLEDYVKDAVLCFAVVSTGSVLLGTIFVPRTYLMTLAAARNKLTSTLPSLATATSAMDIYRAGVQPVYDCVNVAAINAVAVARAGITPLQRPDLYSCPTLPEDEDFDVRCDSPVNDDKMTRF